MKLMLLSHTCSNVFEQSHSYMAQFYQCYVFLIRSETQTLMICVFVVKSRGLT